MGKVEVRIWADNAGRGTPLVIRGNNFSPLMRAMKIIDNHKTQDMIDTYKEEMDKLLRRG